MAIGDDRSLDPAAHRRPFAPPLRGGFVQRQRTGESAWNIL